MLVDPTQNGLAGVAGHSDPERQAHAPEHLLHSRSHVAADDLVDMVVYEEAGNAGMVAAFGALVVEVVPANLDFFPANDPAGVDFGHRDATRATPALTDLTIRCEVDADHHPEFLHSTMNVST